MHPDTRVMCGLYGMLGGTLLAMCAYFPSSVKHDLRAQPALTVQQEQRARHAENLEGIILLSGAGVLMGAGWVYTKGMMDGGMYPRQR